MGEDEEEEELHDGVDHEEENVERQLHPPALLQKTKHVGQRGVLQPQILELPVGCFRVVVALAQLGQFNSQQVEARPQVRENAHEHVQRQLLPQVHQHVADCYWPCVSLYIKTYNL